MIVIYLKAQFEAGSQIINKQLISTVIIIVNSTSRVASWILFDAFNSTWFLFAHHEWSHKNDKNSFFFKHVFLFDIYQIYILWR